MAIFSLTSPPKHLYFLSLKLLLVSALFLSTALILKFSIPPISQSQQLLSSVSIPLLYNSLRSWLTPPYLYFVINGIIIIIVASSRFQLTPRHEDAGDPPEKTTPADVPHDVAHEDYRDVAVVKEKESTPPEAVLLINPLEKPPVSTRFSHRRSATASSEGGKSLRVAKPKRQDTLESTWRKITEGRSVPLARHLKKSDTWETHTHNHNNNNNISAPLMESSTVDDEDVGDRPTKKMMKKAETFNEKSQSSLRRSSKGSIGKMKKEPSLGQEELNKRVEAFIKKFNEEMRLQRQESLNQYMEMINRDTDQ
ncbi:hypothetical protein Scep_028506 [Stephania cephalantha]|uniref:DUF4408 domain-containing protein n=1 Tax=Stephania cephalantha TaxID=152367 RepID=A0AAP0EIG1_9MAGN